MNLNLNEWNEFVDYGNTLCERLAREGYNVRLEPYTLYDGNKGLYIRLFDKRGNFYAEYASGIHKNINSAKNGLENCARIIRNS